MSKSQGEQIVEYLFQLDNREDASYVLRLERMVLKLGNTLEVCVNTGALSEHATLTDTKNEVSITVGELLEDYRVLIRDGDCDVGE